MWDADDDVEEDEETEEDRDECLLDEVDMIGSSST